MASSITASTPGRYRRTTLMRCPSLKCRGLLIGCLVGWCGGISFATAQESLDDVETLTAIEVDATIIEEERDIRMPEPETMTVVPSTGVMTDDGIMTTMIPRMPPAPATRESLRDSTADRKGVRKPVRPIRTDRPPYPQIARKRGWEGTVVLRLTVNREGTVERVNTHKSSGFPDLDESAAQAVKTWRFSPAKDGEFPISATVDLPVRFDLDEYND